MAWINGQWVTPTNGAGQGSLIAGRSPLTLGDWMTHPIRSAGDFMSGPPAAAWNYPQQTPAAPPPVPMPMPQTPMPPPPGQQAPAGPQDAPQAQQPAPQQAPQGPLPMPPPMPPPAPPMPGASPQGVAPTPQDTGATPAQPAGGDRLDGLIARIWPNESGGKTNAKNPLSSASGLLQVTDGTWANFLKSSANIDPTTGQPFKPGDKNLPSAQKVLARNYLSSADTMLSSALGRPATDGEVLSSWMLGPAGVKALATADPNSNAMSVYASVAGADIAKKAFSQNGKLLTPDMTSAQALASAAAHFGAAGGTPGTPGDGAVENSMTAVSAPVDPNANPTDQDSQRLRYLQEAQKFIPHPGNTEMGLALASGLLSGPTFGQGLSKGLAQVQGLRADDRKAQLQALNYAGSMAYKDAMLGIRGKTVDQGQQKIDAANKKLQDALGNYGEANPTANAIMKASVTAIPKWTAAVQAAQDGDKLIGAINDGLNAGQGFTQPDIQTKVKAAFSTLLGVPVSGVTPTGVFVGGKLLNTAAMQQMAENAKGNTLRLAAIAKIDAASAVNNGMTPDAIRTILGLKHSDNQRIMQTNAQLQAAMKDPTTFRHLMIDNGGLDNYVGKLQTEYYAKNDGVAPGTLPTGHVVPTPDGKSLQFQDKTSSGIGFTLH